MHQNNGAWINTIRACWSEGILSRFLIRKMDNSTRRNSELVLVEKGRCYDAGMYFELVLVEMFGHYDTQPVNNDWEEDGFCCHDVWRPWSAQVYQKQNDGSPTLGRIEETLFPLVSVWVWHKEPGNYIHLIFFTRKYSLIAKFGTSLIIWRSEILHFVC